MSVESDRVRKLNSASDRPDRRYVFYWSQMNRRVDANHALLYAVELANQYQLPVLFYEGLTCSYEYANDRLHVTPKNIADLAVCCATDHTVKPSLAFLGGSERPIFGKMRYMSLAGMQRKTDTQAYISEINELEKTGKDPLRIG